MEAYKDVLRYGIDKIRGTLAYKQGRVLGGVLFTCGAPGAQWSWFDHNTDEMKEIAVFVKGVMAEEPIPPEKPIEPPIEPPPPTTTCRGAPREQYARTYLCVPQHATVKEFLSVAATAFKYKQTAGFSADDACVGDLDNRTAVFYDLSAYQRGEYDDWVQANYPGVRVEFRDYPEMAYEFKLANRPCLTTRVTQYFGENEEYYYKMFGLCCGHNGVDFATPLGEEIRATADGWIKSAGNDPGGYGLHVRLDHNPALNDDEAEPQQWLTIYAHMNSFMPWVEDDLWVSAGTVLGYADSTGVSTGNHLHYEIRHDNVAVDPWPYLEELGTWVA